MEFEKIKDEKNYLEFNLINSNETLANTIRRTIITSVPVFAADKIEIIENDSPMYDETIAHRIAMIPFTYSDNYIKKDKCECKGKGCNKCTVTLIVKKKGKWKGYGKLNIEKAFVVSSNVYFAKLGVNIGIKKMCEGATKFYFDKQILWNTSNPLLNSFYPIKLSLFSKSIDGRRKNLTLEDIAWQSIGQGEVLVTPLHMALIAGTIANRGIMMMPKIELNKHSEVLTVPITRKTAEKLKEMMTKVVEKGTGRRAKIKGIKIAGKTGTAEVKDKRPHAWFVGFAPAENPKIAFAVIVENRGFGGSVAAPIARKVILKAKELRYF